MSMKRASFTQYRYLAKFYTTKEYSTYDHQRTFRAVRYDGGKTLGEDCNFYNPHANRQYRSAALQHRRQYCHRKIRGRQRLAAVGSASPILNLLLVLFVGISVGAGVMVSQYFGARQREELSMTIGNCVTLTAISSLIIMFLGAVLSRPLLEMLHTPDSIIDWCTSYLVILMVGCMGSAYYNILCGILRGLGDSISALLYLLVATVLNIILDIVFVSRLQMGVAGVAYATVIAQAVSAILCFWKLLRMTDIFDFKFRHLKMKKKYTLEIIRLGLPSGITQAIFSMAMVIVQSLTNSFGEMVIAANVIIMRVDGFAMMPNFSFGTAMTTYAGQNVGAHRMDRVEQGARQEPPLHWEPPR